MSNRLQPGGSTLTARPESKHRTRIDYSTPMIGMGCMRLSTERDRDEARAIAVLHAAFDSGVTFLDTADAYCLDTARFSVP